MPVTARTAFAFARRYGPTMYRMARKGLRWYGKRKRITYNRRGRSYLRGAKYRRIGSKGRSMRFSTKNIGYPVGVGTTKRCLSSNTIFFNMSTKNFYQQPLTNVTGGQNINRRERDVINMRGVRIQMELKNLKAASDKQQIYFHWCVISDKQDPVSDPDGQEFFRAFDDSRATDFTSTLSSIQLNGLPINTDRYVVLRHRRMQLSGWEIAQYRYVSEWIPLRRQLRYDAATNGNPVTGGLHLCYWCCYMGEGVSSPILNAVEFSHRAYIYFKEAKH